MIARELGWTLDEMRQLYPSELNAIVNELQKQKMVEGYAEQRNKWAFLAAVITNGFSALACVFSGKKKTPKLVDADAFMTKEYKKLIRQIITGQKEEDKISKLIHEAKQRGLKGPW